MSDAAYRMSADQVCEELGVNPDLGLTSDEVTRRKQEYGLNKLQEEKQTPLFIKFLAQLKDPMLLVLIGAAVVSFVLEFLQGDPNISEPVVIVLVVLANAFLGVFQEAKAEAALDALKKMSQSHTMVVRNQRREEIPSEDLVPGDIIHLQAGDAIPADCRLIEVAQFQVEEASLTGESEAVYKTVAALGEVPDAVGSVDTAGVAGAVGAVDAAGVAGAVGAASPTDAVGALGNVDSINAESAEQVSSDKQHVPANSWENDIALADRTNMVYAGSVVVHGRANAVVVATGMHTEMGHIAHAISDTRNNLTPLQKKLVELSKFLTFGVLAICVVIFVLSCLKHGSEALSSPSFIMNIFMTAIALAVAAIPEGLAAVVTIVLSLGVTRMSKRNAIIRKLTAVETLGCTQVICSDKTGTLTQNKMRVVARKTFSDSDEKELMRGMALCSDALFDDARQVATGEPTEVALVEDAAKQGLSTSELNLFWRRIGEVPFDSARKMMSVVVEENKHQKEQAPQVGSDGHNSEAEHNRCIVQYTKGGLDEVLARCTHILKDGVPRVISKQDKEHIQALNQEMTSKAFRVLALAKREWDRTPTTFTEDALENNLCFIGVEALIDPVRPDVKPSIKEAQQAGIRVVMITGDHVNTACAIAQELGIISSKKEALTGLELNRMSDDELARTISNYGVYARVQPEHKVRIVEAWQKQGCVVAMTGDGVNDAPSIKRADIGIGMGQTGTDVTKSVADMVLADDNFSTIVVAVREGRRIYDNIRKAILFLLSCNLAEVLVVFGATLVGFSIFQPLQLLWINLLSDTFPAIALGFEKAEKDVMERPPRGVKDGIFAGGLATDMLVQGFITAALTFISYFIGHFIEFHTMDITQIIMHPMLGKDGTTMAFLTLSFIEMFQSFNMRSQRGSLLSLHTHNLWLWGACAITFVLTTIVVVLPGLASIFGFASITVVDYSVALVIGALIIPLVEFYKWIMRSRPHQKAQQKA